MASPSLPSFSAPISEAALAPEIAVSAGIRAFEITLSLLVLLVLGWIILLQWLWIRFGTPGPGLFFQQRLGRNAQPFRFVKLRTMYVDARHRWPELYAYSYDQQQLRQLFFKVDQDPRVTPQGRWLRRSSLDELPNFWNVLTGEMALVGPRPEIPEMLPYYVGEMRQKFAVRPGITGLAQISGRGRLGFHQTVELDCEYVRNRSFFGDLSILCKTVQMIILHDGAF